MNTQISRGGAKPKMLPASSDVFIDIGNGRKSGIYELSAKRTSIARRVELPQWLSELVKAGGSPLDCCMSAEYPKAEIGESRGHIFMRPPRSLFKCPAVGVDLEVYDTILDDPRIESVLFYVYATGYELVGVWGMSADQFVDLCKRVQTKPQFMPQMMVPLSALTEKQIPSIH